jgi:DNA-binding GntR family transcriptional regulator
MVFLKTTYFYNKSNQGTAMKSDTARAHSRKPKSLVDHVYNEIQNKILYNVWGTGYHALEQELAEELKVSRTPVREALIRLQRDGLVKVVPRHGMRVLPISLTDIQEIHEILTSLEGLAVQLAAARPLTPKELELLESPIRRMNEAHSKSDIKAWAQADEDFHCNLVELSGNRILTEVVDNFWSRAKRARLTMLSMRTNTADSIQEHARLVEAIRNGESAKAREILEDHRKRGITNLKKLMEERRDILQL